MDIWLYCPDKYSHGFMGIIDEYTIKTVNQSESYIFRKENEEWIYDLNSQFYDIDFE